MKVSTKTLLALGLVIAIQNISCALPNFCKSHGYSNGSKVFGDIKCKNGNLKNLSAFGNADLRNITIAGNLSARGHLYGDQLTIGHNVTVYGYATFKNSEISGNSTIHGALSTNQSTFDQSVGVYGHLSAYRSNFSSATVYGDVDSDQTSFSKAINIYGHKAKFDNSSVASITMSNSNLTPQVFLSGNSKITGNINFPKKSGVVYKESGVIFTGKIINGSLGAPTTDHH